MSGSTAAPLSLPYPTGTDLLVNVDDAIKALADRLAATLGAEPWLAVGGAGNPAFSGAWVNYGAPNRAAAFRRIGDRVEIRGLVKTGVSGTSVFTLPAGYRPTSNEHRATIANAAIGMLEVQTTGLVLATGNNAYISLACQFSVL